MTDGISALRNRTKGERKNPIPPPRNKPREKPVDVLPTPAVDDAAVEQQPAAEVASIPESKPSAPRFEQRGTEAPESGGVVHTADVAQSGRLVKKTISLSSTDEQFLQAVTVAGMLHPGGKVDANQSAIIRLALRELRASMSEIEIVERIKGGQTVPGKSGGRPRF